VRRARADRHSRATRTEIYVYERITHLARIITAIVYVTKPKLAVGV
jgi:hypothetical protein